MSAQCNSEKCGTSPYVTFAIWFGVGAIVGAGIGLATAPAPGAETRAAFGEKLKLASEAAMLHWENARSAAEDYAGALRTQINRLGEAVSAGVDETRRIRDELYETQGQES